MSAIQKALADVSHSYCAAKASVSDMTSSLLAAGPGGIPIVRPDLARAHEEQRHFRGWVYTSIRPIAQRIAGQPIHVGRKTARRLPGAKQAQQPEPLETHPLLDLLANPNDLMVAWSLIYTSVASLELTGRRMSAKLSRYPPTSVAIFITPTPMIRTARQARCTRFGRRLRPTSR